MAWGAGRVAALEHPRLWGGLIDLPAIPTARPRRRLPSSLPRCPARAEKKIAIRPAASYARRLTRAPAPATPPGSPWTPAGTTLITGGTGGIGATIARWLARNGAPRLLLLSRQGPAHPDAQALTADLTAHGTHATITACDVTDPGQLRRALAAIPPQHPLTTAIHTAGLPRKQTPHRHRPPAP